MRQTYEKSHIKRINKRAFPSWFIAKWLKILSISVQIFRMKHKKAMFVPRREGISCRIEKENPLTDSPLVTLPDYTFMDGRPAPLGVIEMMRSGWGFGRWFLTILVPFKANQMQRLMKQREWAGKIVSQLGELDFAKQRHAKMVQAKEEERSAILNSNLKEKGAKLLKKRA